MCGSCSSGHPQKSIRASEQLSLATEVFWYGKLINELPNSLGEPRIPESSVLNVDLTVLVSVFEIRSH